MLRGIKNVLLLKNMKLSLKTIHVCTCRHRLNVYYLSSHEDECISTTIFHPISFEGTYTSSVNIHTHFCEVNDLQLNTSCISERLFLCPEAKLHCCGLKDCLLTPEIARWISISVIQMSVGIAASFHIIKGNHKYLKCYYHAEWHIQPDTCIYNTERNLYSNSNIQYFMCNKM